MQISKLLVIVAIAIEVKGMLGNECFSFKQCVQPVWTECLVLYMLKIEHLASFLRYGEHVVGRDGSTMIKPMESL